MLEEIFRPRVPQQSHNPDYAVRGSSHIKSTRVTDGTGAPPPPTGVSAQATQNWIAQQAEWFPTLKGKHGATGELGEDDYNFVNKYLERKTLHALSSIVFAADMKDGWFVCHGPPSSNETRVSTAMLATGSYPKCLVVDNWKNYRQYWFDNHLEEKIFKLKYDAKPLQEVDDLDSLTTSVSFKVRDNYDMLHRRNSVYFPPRTGDNDGVLDLWDNDKRPGRPVARFPWSRGTHFIFSG